MSALDRLRDVFWRDWSVRWNADGSFSARGERKLTAVRNPRAARTYAAGEDNRLTALWGTDPYRIDEVVRYQREKLVKRCRQQYRSNPYARSVISLQEINTVGSRGLTLVCRPKRPDGSVDAALGNAVERAWREFALTTQCDRRGMRTLTDMQRLYVRGHGIEGEVLARFSYGIRSGATNVQVDLLDSLRLPADHDVDLANGNFIRASVEYDLDGAPVAYWIETTRSASGATPEGANALGGHVTALGRRYYLRIPAKDIVHDFFAEEPEQRRGIPRLATIVDKLRMLDGYHEAALVAARVGASKMAWIKRPEPVEEEGDEEETAQELTYSAEPGEIGRLDHDEELVEWRPDYPRAELEGFSRLMLQGIAAGGNVSYAPMGRDTTRENYSSMQSNRLQDAHYYEAFAERLEHRFVMEVFRRWLPMALSNGQIHLGDTDGLGTIPSERLPKILDGVSWARDAMRSINPATDAQARRIEVEAGLRSRSSVIREVNPTADPLKVFQEIADEQALFRRLGIEITSDGTSVAIADPMPMAEDADPEPDRPEGGQDE